MLNLVKKNTIRPIRKAVFPVGGMGTRFFPATKAMPKEMLPVVDKPLIQYAVEEAQAAGIEEFIFVTGKGKTAIEDHFDASPELEAVFGAQKNQHALKDLQTLSFKEGQVSYTRQHRPLGLGHAVWCARHLVGDEPFAVLLADDFILGETPCLQQMIQAYNQTGSNLVAVMEVPKAHTSRYGIIEAKESASSQRLLEISNMVEKPAPEKAPSPHAIIGRYILQPEIFTHLEKHKVGAGNEIQLTDALVLLLATQPFYGYRFQGRRFDCGNKLGLLSASLYQALQTPELTEGLKQELKALMDLEESNLQEEGVQCASQ